MAKQVITIKKDGSIHGLQHKRGKGLDLRKLGKADIKRVTLIEWEPNIQRWFIRWANNETGFWGEDIFEKAGIDPDEFGGHLRHDPMLDHDDLIYFEEYDDAVKAEVAVIQSFQLAGRFNFDGSGVL